MNQEKIGKLIAELRKEKNLTQEELAEKFSIAPQSVSKWERGINMPDISALEDLCKILEVDVNDFLRGEISKNNSKTGKNISKEVKEENEKVIIEAIKYYEKRAKNKYIRRAFIIFTILVTLIAIVSVIYSISNYNKIKIYKLVSNEENLDINGRIIFNPSNKIITINSIRYNDDYIGTIDEIKAKSMELKLLANDKIIYETGNLEYDKQDKAERLSFYLDEIKVDLAQSKNESNLKESDLSDCIVRINYIDSNNQNQTIDFKLQFEEEFVNNSLFYN